MCLSTNPRGASTTMAGDTAPKQVDADDPVPPSAATFMHPNLQIWRCGEARKKDAAYDPMLFLHEEVSC
jgi:hypothetical protein